MWIAFLSIPSLPMGVSMSRSRYSYFNSLSVTETVSYLPTTLTVNFAAVSKWNHLNFCIPPNALLFLLMGYCCSKSILSVLDSPPSRTDNFSDIPSGAKDTCIFLSVFRLWLFCLSQIPTIFNCWSAQWKIAHYHFRAVIVLLPAYRSLYFSSISI